MAQPDFTRRIPSFLDTFLSKPASSLPKGGQWVVDFENLSSVKKAIIETGKRFPYKKWNVEASFNTVTAEDYTKRGCLFAQAVEIPGESVVVNPEGIQKNHFIRTATGDGKSDYATALRMVFLNTNVSFVENVIRPWVLTTARLGLIARPDGDQQYRQNISVYKLGVVNSISPPYIAELYTFFGACPIEVTSEEYNYTPLTSPILREVTFTFHTYTLETYTPDATIARTALNYAQQQLNAAQRELAARNSARVATLADKKIPDKDRKSAIANIEEQIRSAQGRVNTARNATNAAQTVLNQALQAQQIA
jgi:hypothetical protein